MPRFGCVINPGRPYDLVGELKYLRRLPESILEGLTRWVPPFTLSGEAEITSRSGVRTTGALVGLPLTPKQMTSLPDDFVYKRIIQAGKLAQRQGVEILGLGMLPVFIGDAGKTVSAALDIPITTGLTYDLASAVDAIRFAVRSLQIKLHNSHLVVIGADGLYGTMVARTLGAEVGFLTLWGQEMTKIDRLAVYLLHEQGISAKIAIDPEKAMKAADIIVFDIQYNPALRFDLLKEKVVIYRSRNCPSVQFLGEQGASRLVIDGAIVKPPEGSSLECMKPWPSLPNGVVRPSVAEPAVLALDGRLRNLGIGGKVILEDMVFVSETAKTQGFKVVGYESGDRVVMGKQVANTDK